MQLVKVVKKTNSKIDQVKTLLSIFCLLSDIKVSKSELMVLAYFVVYGMSDETRERIIVSEILSEDSVKNTISRLIKFGLIKKDKLSKQVSLSDKINIRPEPTLGMLIKLDNT